MVFFAYIIINSTNIKYVMYLCISIVVIMFYNPFSNILISRGFFHQSFSTGDAEALSVPLMQVARTVTYYESYIDDDEKIIIGECFYYGYEDISSNYNPNISDSIKYNFDVEKSKKNGFWKVYIDLFKRCPIVYFESVIAKCRHYC